MPKKESSVIPVRLSEEVLNRIDAVAEMIGTTRTALIRLCADTFAGHISKGGKAALPIDWRDILEQHDGRTRAARGEVHRLNVHLNDEASTDPLPPRQPDAKHPKPAKKPRKPKA